MTPTDKGDGSSDKTCVFDSGQQGFLTRGNRVAHDVLYQLPLHGEAGVAHLPQGGFFLPPEQLLK